MKEIYLTEDGTNTIKCYDQILFKDGESGKRIWEAGIVMARFLHQNIILGQTETNALDGEFLWGVNQIVEFGSGTGISTLSLIRNYINK